MTESPIAYIPTDRRHALVAGVDLPGKTFGAAVFADISGFTPLTEALIEALGPQRGAEELPVQLNRIYDALVAQVDNHRGSVLSFSGDAITCWFDESGNGGWSAITLPSATQRATVCALAMQKVMQQFANIEIPGVGIVSLAVKVAVATGPVVRFLVGDSSIQIVDVLAGETLQRLARAEHMAERGDVVIDAFSATALDEPHNIAEWRLDSETNERFAVVTDVEAAVVPDPWPELPTDSLSEEVLRPWLLPPVANRLFGGLGEFLTELRPAVSMFVRFEGIDYDDDPEARNHLDTFVRAIQQILDRYETYVLQIAIGDKGSYFNACFGAPVAHGDDPLRAVLAALEIRELRVPVVDEVQIGIARGRFRTGAYGGVTRRTYGVFGDEVNLAARLMQAAPKNEVFVDETVQSLTANSFVWDRMDPMQVKGKTRSIQAYRLIRPLTKENIGIRQPDYALPMIGRERELATVIDRLERAISGGGQIVGVTGEAGIGKTRLIAEVLNQARNLDIAGFGGECQSFGVNASYLVWHDIVRSLFGLAHDDPTVDQLRSVAEQLAIVNPALVDRLPLLGGILNLSIADNDLTASFSAALRKGSLESLLVEVLRAKANARPLLFVFEDTQWLDPLSRDLLQVVVRAISDLPVLLLIVYRPIDVASQSALRFDGIPHFIEVALADLPDEDIGRLVQAKLQHLYGEDTIADADLVEQLRIRAQGNPFYIEELLNFLNDRGLDPRQPNPLAQVALPDTLYSLILGRIDHLSEDQKTALKVASVIGRLFVVAMLNGVYPPFAEREGLASDLDTLTQMELTVLEAPDPELAYLFKHVLTQEVAYETLSFATRAMLHDQIGRYIEARNVDGVDQHLDVLAHHYDRSENLGKRQLYLRKAGEAAQAASANTSAINYYERVLPLLPDGDRMDVLLQLGRVQELVGDWISAEGSNRQTLVLAESNITSPLNRRARARAHHALGVLERKRGQSAAALEFFERSREDFELLSETAGESKIAAEIGDVYRLQGRFGDAHSFYEKSLQIAGQISETAVRRAASADALKGAGVVASVQGDYSAARAFIEESLSIRREMSDKPGVAALLNNQAVLARFQHDLEGARKLNDESLLLLREVGDQWAVGQLLNNQACVAADQTDYRTARALLAESLSIRRQLGDRVGLALSLNTLADVLVDEGDYLAAMPLLDESMGLYRELGDNSGVAYLLDDYAAVAAFEGRSGAALRIGGFAAALRDEIGASLAPAEQLRVERLLAPARSSLNVEETEASWLAGQKLALALDFDSLFSVGTR
jgi:adenylate cyclase